MNRWANVHLFILYDMIDIEKLREFCEAYIKDRGYFLTDLTISKDNDIVV